MSQRAWREACSCRRFAYSSPALVDPVRMGGMTVSPDLPIEPLIPDLRRILENSVNVVLQAPPGAGKTTRVPLALLEQPWLGGQRVIVLEPRRLAARAAARRMAALLGETVGET